MNRHRSLARVSQTYMPQASVIVLSRTTEHMPMIEPPPFSTDHFPGYLFAADCAHRGHGR